MARGDKADLFFRKLRTAGLTKPAVETLAERLDALEAADSAASGALSTTKLAYVAIPIGTVPITHGLFQVDVDFTGSSIFKGANYWQVPGSALDLDVTIAGGNIVLPDDDCQYDLLFFFAVLCDVADVGKSVGLAVAGNNANTAIWSPAAPGVLSTSQASLFGSAVDQRFIGDGPGPITVSINSSLLTVDALLYNATVLITRR